MLAIAGCPLPIAGTTTETGTETSTTAATTDTDAATEAGTTEAAPTTSGPGFDGVIAPTIRTYRPRVGVAVEAPHDPLPDHASVTIVADGEEVAAVYDGSARLEFAGVPEDMYLLRAQQPADPALAGEPGVPYFTHTAERVVKIFAGVFSGRPDVASTEDLATQVVVSASGMQALAEEDQFELYSYNADAQLLVFPSLDPMDTSGSPELGATEIADWTIAWRPGSGRRGWPLVDPGAGDDLWLGHLAARPLVAMPVGAELDDPWSYAQIYSLVEAAELSLAPMAAGAMTTASGAFVPVGNSVVSLDLRASEFMAELEIYDAPLKSVGCFVAGVMEPGVDHPITGMTPNLGGINVYGKDILKDPSCMGDSCETIFAMPGDRVLALEFGNPYIMGTKTLTVQCSRYIFVKDPNGVDYDYLASDLIVSGPLSELAQGPITPKMGLVRDLTLNGVAAPPDPEMIVEGVGLTPTVAFTAPKFGAPDLYTVTVRTIDDVEGADGPVPRRTVGVIRTEFTSVAIPAGILKAGGHYYIQVAAERGRRLTEASPDSHDVFLSRAMTGVFTP